MNITVATVDNLNSVMEFDHVIRVHADGTVTDEPNVHAPELYDGELGGTGWTLLNGYSGQYNYAGPIMHNSEYIGGGLARDILAQPGVYVALVNGTLSDDEDDAEGWAVARLDD